MSKPFKYYYRITANSDTGSTITTTEHFDINDPDYITLTWAETKNTSYYPIVSHDWYKAQQIVSRITALYKPMVKKLTKRGIR